jgi:L-Ala-D/L-Glu epimerase / N-acetyl-D-glutamate racemase
VKLEVRRRTLRLSAPLHAAYGTVGERELVIVSLTDEDGAVGYGEAAPLEPYGGAPLARVLQALERYRAVLASHAGPGAAALEACRRADDVPEALAAIDLALWDRAGKRAGRPVAALLSDGPAGEIAVNATITAEDAAGASEQAARAVADGFACLKLKVGMGDDAGRVAAVRAAAGHGVALRLDANGAWSVDQAVRAIEAFAPAGLELVEEPVHGLSAVREVRERVPVRVAIDETAAEPGALASGAADAVCLKLARCGGIAALLAAAALVRATGAEVYVSSTLDGPIGIAAAVHAVAALAERRPLPPCGLATIALFEGIGSPLELRRGAIRVPSAPGLGVGPF